MRHAARGCNLDMLALDVQLPCADANKSARMNEWLEYVVGASLCPQGCNLWQREQACQLFDALTHYKVLN